MVILKLALLPLPTERSLLQSSRAKDFSVNVPDRSVGPEVVEFYRDYVPPVNLRAIVKALLKTVPPNYLVGLKTIVLTNQSALSRDERQRKSWQHGRKRRFAKALGAYSRATRYSPASIRLMVDNIAENVHVWTLRTPVLRHLIVASVLYHEIGHHIHAAHLPVYEGKENVAEDWSRKLSKQFCGKHFWYLTPIFYCVSWSIRIWKRMKREAV
jgi:hypothetical protein